MKTLKKLSIIFASMFMLAAFAGCDDGGSVEHQASEFPSKTEASGIFPNGDGLQNSHKIELAENLKNEYGSLNINSISRGLARKYKFAYGFADKNKYGIYTTEDINKMTNAGYGYGHDAFVMTSAELKESFNVNSDNINDYFKTPEQDVKIYYGIYKLDSSKEIQGVILTEETRTPAQFSQEGKLSKTMYNTDIDNAICEFKGYLSVGTIIETQDRDTASEKHIWYPGTITITSIVLKN
ncbi:hypothetical protein [uncultured Treponema sp.]|uniref:hypothetical protein n=1 Tax=uncultured Treponema sp. TaxID=162155 RepID=UPI0025DB2018|nr:hypothetical protein [uncultured Treponema sp.]